MEEVFRTTQSSMIMGASRTETHEPTKVYFTPSEATKILDCSKYELRKLTSLIPNCGRQEGKGWRRYSVKEINQMMKIRSKTVTPRP